MTDLRAQLQSTLGDAYAIERELGGGGMSRVFVATEHALGRPVVVKVLPSEMAGAVSVERFRREIRLAASLQQANIVPVLSAGDAGGVAYYTMPFVKGESLRSHLAASGALPIAECVAILRDVARALAYAHGEGVVHRDIKPENILLSGGTAVVTDFGIAKAVAASSTQPSSATLTQMGIALGTPAYMAPEQAVGENVDHRADLYSLGVVAYEMLTGTAPFAGRSAQAMLAAHVVEAPAPLATKCPDAPARLVALVTRCLAKEQVERPESAAAVLEELETVTTPQAVIVTKREDKPSIAVLPFANLSPDPADEYFADGLTDEIITDLSALHALRVIARASMMRFKGSGKEPEAVARELHVRYALDGSVRRAGTSLRLTVRLTDTADGSVLWSDKLGGSVEDVFAMQEKVSRTIVEALRVTLTPREEHGLAARPIKDLRAYEAFLQARQLMWTFTIESLGRAVQLLENALELVGDDARLIGTLGQTHVHYLHAGLPEPERHVGEAERCIRRLVATEPDSFFIHSLAGQLHLQRGEIREAIASHESARTRDPNDAATVCLLSLEYLMSGRDSQAREAADFAATLDPLTPLFQCMPGFCLAFGGRAAEGVPYYRRFLAMEPLNPTPHLFLQMILAHAGETREAIAIGEELERRFPGSVFAQLGIGYSRGLQGDTAGARAAVTPAVRAAAAQTEMFSRLLMDLFAMIGDADEAAAAAETAAAKGLAHYPWLARHNRFVAPHRDQPRFRRVLEVIRGRWERGGTSAADLTEVAAPTTSAKQEKPTIAVLPLRNLSVSQDDEYFSDGITEDIIAHLSQIASIRVISRTSVVRFKKTDKPLKVIAAELGASHIVEGSVRRAAQKLRIVAQLIDARSDEHLWAQTFDRELTDVFAIQTEVADAITTALRARLVPQERARIARKPTDDQEAYNLYLLARHHLNNSTAGGFERAIELYKQAVARDPKFARAWAAMAFAHFFHLAGYYARPKDIAPRVIEYANRALALDPDLAEAHLILGGVEEWINFDQSANGMRRRRAVELSPNFADARLGYGNYLVITGRWPEALDEARRALELDPASELTHLHANWLRYLVRDFDGALAGAAAAESLFGQKLLPTVRAETLVAMGRPAEGVAICRELCRRDPMQLNLGLFAWCLAAAGDVAEARAVLSDLHARERAEYVWPMPVAVAYAHLRDMDEAFHYLDRCVAEGVAWVEMAYAPTFDPFRGDARFASIVKRVGAIAPSSLASRSS